MGRWVHKSYGLDLGQGLCPASASGRPCVRLHVEADPAAATTLREGGLPIAPDRPSAPNQPSLAWWNQPARAKHSSAGWAAPDKRRGRRDCY